MFKEKRFLYFAGPEARSYEEDEPVPITQAPAEAAEQERPGNLEYARGISEIAVDLETGQMDDAAMKFYDLFLKTPGKMKGYRDLMIATTTPLVWLTKDVPLLGKLAQFQRWASDKVIDGFFSMMKRFQQIKEENPGYQALKRVEGHWNELSDTEKESVKLFLDSCVNGVN